MRTALLASILSAAVILGLSSPSRADECGDLIDKLAAVTKATLGDRSRDFATFTAGPNTGLTVACGSPSSIGAQFAGETPPEAYFELFGQAGALVTKAKPEALAAAAHQAREVASRMRHSNVDLPGVRVTCSVTTSPTKGPLTLCAAVEHDDRS